VLQAEDGIKLNGLDKKWEVEQSLFVDKLKALHLFEKACLELWIKAFWDGNREGQTEAHKTDCEQYIQNLL